VSTKQPITSRSIFPIGSLTKSFTALVVLKLVEENKLSIEDPISRYITGYPNGDRIKIKHLLTNSGGIYEKFRNPEFYAQLTSTHEYSHEGKMVFFNNQPLDFEPGTQFSYSNSGFDLLGIIIENVTKSSYSEAVRKYIFKPLKMTNSGFDFPNLQSKNKVSTYSFISSSKHDKAEPWNASLTFSSGGLYSTTEDLGKFYYGLTDFKIINAKTFRLATTPYLGGYGYGWFIDQIHGERVIDHGGNIEGATSYFLTNPELDICIILLNNITSTSLENIGNDMYSALRSKPYRIPQPKREIQLDDHVLQKYTGVFKASEKYQVTVLKESGKLFIRINNGNRIPFLAEKENIFYTNDADIVLEFISTDAKINQLQLRQGLSTKVADRI
jgi:CubicO group peptidase (beta-lactamase class C family)